MKLINESFQNIKKLVTEFSDNQKASEANTNNQEKVNFSNEIQNKLSPEETQKLTSFYFRTSDISEFNEQLIMKVGIQREMKDIEDIEKVLEETKSLEIIDSATSEKEWFFDPEFVYEYHIKVDEIRNKVGLYLEDKNILNPGESGLIHKLEKNPHSIRTIRLPSERLQLVAINQDYETIEYIRNPTEEVQLIAVKHDPDLIRYIKKPTERVQLTAINQDCNCIGYIENPTENVQLIAVKQDPFIISKINNPSEDAQILALEIASERIKCSEDFQLAVIRSNSANKYVQQNATRMVQLELTHMTQLLPISSENIQLAPMKQNNIEASCISSTKELHSSGSKTLLADVSLDTGTRTGTYRIHDRSTGKTEVLSVGDIDLCKQPSESVKGLLSGKQVEITNTSGLKQMMGLSKTPAGWGLQIGKQAFSAADKGAEI